VKERHYAFNVIRELMLLVKSRMHTLYSMLIESFLTEGFEELLRLHSGTNNNYRREWNELTQLIQLGFDREPSF